MRGGRVWYGMVWHGMPCGLGAAHPPPLTFPVKGPGSRQQPGGEGGGGGGAALTLLGGTGPWRAFAAACRTVGVVCQLGWSLDGTLVQGGFSFFFFCNS